MEKIGDRIKHLREGLGLSQEELADMLGYKSKSSINKIEMGFQDVPRAKLEAFARALHTSPDELSGWRPLLAKEEASFSYCLERQAYLIGWTYLEDEEGNVILSRKGKSYQITADNWKDFEKRMILYMEFILREMTGGLE